jgi:hypothetical protein
MTSWKEWLWHVLRLGLAVVLLAIDIRWFACYAFTLLLMVLHHIDHPRAGVRCYQGQNDGRFILLLRHAGVTNEEARALTEQIYKDAPPEVQKSLDRDARLVAGWSFVSPRTYL